VRARETCRENREGLGARRIEWGSLFRRREIPFSQKGDLSFDPSFDLSCSFLSHVLSVSLLLSREVAIWPALLIWRAMLAMHMACNPLSCSYGVQCLLRSVDDWSKRGTMSGTGHGVWGTNTMSLLSLTNSLLVGCVGGLMHNSRLCWMGCVGGGVEVEEGDMVTGRYGRS